MTDVYTSRCAPYTGGLNGFITTGTATFIYDDKADPESIIKSVVLTGDNTQIFSVRGENDSVILYVTRTFPGNIVGTNVYAGFTSSFIPGAPGLNVLMDIPGNSITNGTNTITTAAGDHYSIQLTTCENVNNFGAQVKLTRRRKVGVSVSGSGNF